ncbi:perforin-1-like [Scyliorhinus canicula]|uniref:perforin-1-like n=1 Tax=Scyliorhinus canicula TaxID=7830 RepID=UPI0018F5D068|nr:perforin-1-like [Scyliorhinus canicula]
MTTPEWVAVGRRWHLWLVRSLFLLLLTPEMVHASCEVGTANECKKAVPAPGSNLAGEGYNIVRLARTGAYAIDMHTWRRRDGTCTLCRNVLMEGAVQRLPRAAVDWRVRQECRRQVRSALYESDAELAQEGTQLVDKSWSAGLDIRHSHASVKATVAGSKSKMAEFARQRSSSDRYSFSSQSFRCKFYEYRLGHRPPLSLQFRQLLRTLPRQLAAPTRFFYERFLRTFGTHYIKGVQLGGHYRDVTAMRTCKVASERQTVEEVKDCLQIEAEAKVKEQEANAKYESCQEAKNKLAGKRSFHEEYKDRVTEMEGGMAVAGLDLLFSDNPDDFSGWVESLATHPGVIYHVLEPLHLLVKRADPRHGNLRTAISQYIVRSEEGLNCTRRACPHGARADPRDPCSCRCSEDSRVDKQCCSKGKGWAKLSVVVRHGQDLWGDYSGGTDAYVKVSYDQLKASTGVVSNNNNPQWDVTLDLGDLQVEPGLSLRLEVWDRDNGYDDDLLGSCEKPPTSGRHPHVCYFSYGSLTFDLVLVCGPHLGGATCHDYVAQQG